MRVSVLTVTTSTAGSGAGVGEFVEFRALIFNPVVFPLLGPHGLWLSVMLFSWAAGNPLAHKSKAWCRIQPSGFFWDLLLRFLARFAEKRWPR
jgi:hypothetical protein